MPQATPFDNILAQARDLFSERLAAALAGMLDKADEALTALESETRDTEAQALYRETRDKALSQREKIETQFRVRYLREFQIRSNRARKIGNDFADIDLDDIELALVGEDDLEETLKFNAMTARLRQYCEEELIALDQRVGVLFGDAGLLSEDNPFSPQAISDAYKQTGAQLHADVDVRLVLLKLFDEFVLDEIRGIYRAVNTLLVQNSILPKLRGAGVRKERTKTPPAAEPKGSEQDFFALLQNLMKAPAAAVPAAPVATGAPASAAMLPGAVQIAAGIPADPAADGGQPGAAAGYGGGGLPAGVGAVPLALQGPELLSSLTRVQVGDLSAVTGNTVPLAAIMAEPGTTNVLRELKATSLGSGMSHMDAMTLDIVALLFDQLFDDPRIPIGVKGLIGRLQIPFLKVAIADKAFFSKKTHPARQMLDTLGEVAARLPEDVNASNPTFVSLDAILQNLLENFEDDVGIFEEVREKLEALVDEEDQRIEEQALADEKQVEQQESLALAKTVAQTEIKVRLRASKPPQPVLEFLHKQWIKVLLLIQVKEGEDSEAWKRALETMDLLVWSVEPKGTREERREVVGRVPELLRRLTDALGAAGIEDAVRTNFIVELRKLHSEVITGNAAPRAPEPELASAPDATAEPVTAEVSADSAITEPPVTPEQPGVSEPAVEPAETPESQIASAPAAEQPVIEFAPATPESREAPSPLLEMPAVEAGLSLSPAEVSAPAFELPAIEPRTAPAAAVEFASVEPSPAIAPEDTAAVAPADPESAFELPPLEFTPVSPPQSRPLQSLSPQAPPAESGREGAAAEAPASAFDLPSLDFERVTTPAFEPKAAPAPALDLPTIEQTPPPAAKSPSPAPKPDALLPRPLPPKTPAPPPVAKLATPVPAAAKPQAASPKPQPVVAKPKPAPLDLTAPVTVPNPFGEGEVEVNDLDFTVQLRSSAADARPVSALPPALELGSWVDIVRKHGKEKRQSAKLTFISPLKTRYLFSDRHGKTALECSQAELVRLFQLQEVTLGKEPVEPPLFDRLAEGVMGKLGALPRK